MNYAEEKQALDSIINNINILEQEIRDYMCEKSYFRLRKEERRFGSVFDAIKNNDFENKRYLLLAKTKSLKNQVLNKIDLYDKTLTNLHFIQFQLLQRSEVLRDMLVASQIPGTSIQAIFEAMNAKYEKMDTWHKEFSKEFFAEVKKHQEEDEEKARIYVNGTVSELSNALLKPEMHNTANSAKWKDDTFDNYPSLEEAIQKVKSLQHDVQDAQLALILLQNRIH